MDHLAEKDFIIVGAGVSGLALAFYLKQAEFSVVLVEADSQVGGVTRTIHEDGFQIEWGPNSTYNNETLHELAGKVDILDKLLEPNKIADNKFIAHLDKHSGKYVLTRVPRGFFEAATTPILSFWGKLRIMLEPIISKGNVTDESLHSLMTRRVGRELTENVFSAVISGILAGDIRQLSARSAVPKLWAMEQETGSFVRATIKNKRSGKLKKRVLVTFCDGMGTLPKAIYRHLGPEAVMLNTTAKKLSFNEGRIELTVAGGKSSSEKILSARNIVIACPTDGAATLVHEHDRALAENINSIKYASLGGLHLAYKTTDLSHSLDGFGFLVPPSPGRALLGALFISSMFPGRAPEGYHLLTCFVGGAVNPGKSDIRQESCRAQAISELSQLIGARRPPKIIAAVFHPRAIPNYAVGHFTIVEDIAQFEQEHPQVKFLANWQGEPSVGDRIQAAKTLGDNLIANSARGKTATPPRLLKLSLPHHPHREKLP